MKGSYCLRTLAMLRVILVVGTTVVVCRTKQELRMRVSISETVSVADILCFTLSLDVRIV